MTGRDPVQDPDPVPRPDGGSGNDAVHGDDNDAVHGDDAVRGDGVVRRDDEGLFAAASADAGEDADASTDVVVAVEGLARTFPGPPPVEALRPCTFSIRRGEYVAITGASGSGKTTLLSLLGLLDAPTAGTYLLDGIDVSHVSDRERSAVRAWRIGFVFQAFHLVGYRSVVDNVELGLLYQGVPKRRRRALADEVIAEVGLAHRRDAICSRLSGGERQRVAIARTLVRRPSLVLCDEPTGNLDTATTAQVLALLDDLHSRGLTIVVITHDPAVAARGQRHLTISDGTVTERPVAERPVTEPVTTHLATGSSAPVTVLPVIALPVTESPASQQEEATRAEP